MSVWDNCLAGEAGSFGPRVQALYATYNPSQEATVMYGPAPADRAAAWTQIFELANEVDQLSTAVAALQQGS
jgi:hypothetical protein